MRAPGFPSLGPSPCGWAREWRSGRVRCNLFVRGARAACWEREGGRFCDLGSGRGVLEAGGPRSKDGQAGPGGAGLEDVRGRGGGAPALEAGTEARAGGALLVDLSTQLSPFLWFFLPWSRRRTGRQAGEGQPGSADGMEGGGWGAEGGMGWLILRGELPGTAGTRPASVPGTPFFVARLPGMQKPEDSAGRRGSGGQEGGQGCGGHPGEGPAARGPLRPPPTLQRALLCPEPRWGRDAPYPRLRPRRAQCLPCRGRVR